MDPVSIIVRPCVTEKSISISEEANKIVLEVKNAANKIQIKNAVEQLFNVTVLNVNTLRMPEKKVRVGRHLGVKSPWKKAIVTLKDGDNVEFFETT
ncbi:MAG: 50S ribosomal protein L23 [Nitrospinota bacterium]|nr:50S ribosomal protein L23 [Nitrospinota bacterium]